MTLSEYIERRNDVPMGHSKSLRNNLQKSLGAKNFAAFWVYWNPIFGYYLGKKVFKPLKELFPPALSIVLTFIFCGLIHDLVTSLVRQNISLFFSFWFLFMAIFVIITKKIDYDLSKQNWVSRALINLSIIGICFLLTKLLNTLLNFY